VSTPRLVPLPSRAAARPTPSRAALEAILAPNGAPLPDGRTLVLQGAVPGDLPELQAMHARCSEQTLHARYCAGPRPPSRRLCLQLLRTELALVALSPASSVVGLGNLACGDEDEGVAEVAVLVEDDWQGRGLGTVLLRHLVGAARLLGMAEVVAVAGSRGTWVERGLDRLGPTLHQRTPFGESVLRLALAPHHVGLLAGPARAVPRSVVSASARAPAR
jgi:GNAT superfamily N-acetyltransferase